MSSRATYRMSPRSRATSQALHSVGELFRDVPRHWLLERAVGSTAFGAAAGWISHALNLNHEVAVGVVCTAIAVVANFSLRAVSERERPDAARPRRPPKTAHPGGISTDEATLVHLLGHEDGFASRIGDLYAAVRDSTEGWGVARFKVTLQLLRAAGYVADTDGDEDGRFFIPYPVWASEAWIEITLTGKGRKLWTLMARRMPNAGERAR